MMGMVKMADGRDAVLVERDDQSFVVLAKPALPEATMTHTYRAIAGKQQKTWTVTTTWPDVPEGAWAYQAHLTDEGLVIAPYWPVAGGHGRSVEAVVAAMGTG